MRELMPQTLQPGGATVMPGIHAGVTVLVSMAVVVCVLVPLHTAHRGTRIRLRLQPSYTT
ncbi:hypothetical protein [Streptomyces viridosporus]|uniref:hypothetical protein n=1 Tax=Streptomyces viridosporus TaxID=67581 RepID=UPI0002E6C4C2|nr:hypothetical protein [Streptomyces viridosporus]